MRAVLLKSGVLIISVATIAPERAAAIIGGQTVSPEAQLSHMVLQATFGEGRCSAIVLGNNVILTAAQCVGNDKQLRVKTPDSSLIGECSRMPQYAGDNTADYALCFISELTTYLAPPIDFQLPHEGEELVIAGYGCTIKGGLDAWPQGLSVGTARVIGSGSDYLRTEGAAACFGDSGGGVFRRDATGRLSLVGLLSRSDISSISSSMRIADTLFLDWARDWAEMHGVEKCIFDDEESCQELPYASSTVSDTVSISSAPLPPITMTTPNDKVLESDTLILPKRTIRVNALAGETVVELVRRVCGDQDAVYFRLLENWHSQNADATVSAGLPNGAFATNRPFSIPDCPANKAGLRRQPMRVETQKGLWEFWEKVLRLEAEEDADFGWEQWRRASDVIDPLRPFDGPADISSKVFVEVLRALNPKAERLASGSVIQVPISPQRAETSPTVLHADEIEPVLSISHAVCAPSVDKYPYDIDEVLDVLALNARPGVRGWDSKRPVSVLVADSGLLGADGRRGSVFGWGVIADSSSSALSDLRPAFSEGENSRVRHHGTQVAATVLGGPVFARFNARESPPMIKLTAARLYTLVSKIEPDRTVRDFVGLPHGRLEEALEELGSTEIINLSLKTKREIKALHEHLNEDVYLFVAAAGNGDGKIDNDRLDNVFPAQWGGRGNFGERNLIVVAALQANGTIVNQSNHGPEHVEIGAPGCDVPTLVFNERLGVFQRRSVSGTSFAAPLVSFAAALLRGEHGRDVAPHEIKQRLLVSANLDPDLATYISHGRVLHVAKAISLFHDVLQDADGNLHWGNLNWWVDSTSYEPSEDRTVLFDCDSGPRAIAPRDILKLWIGFPRVDGSDGVMVYSRDDSSDLFDADVCAIPDSETLRFDFVDALTESTLGPPWSGVLEVLPKMKLH